jgi:phosphoketolase
VEAGIEHCTKGPGIWDWASYHRDEEHHPK